MSTDYNVVCETCKEVRHLGQRMAWVFSFGYGSKDTETPPKIMRWIYDHDGHDLRIMNAGDMPDSYLDTHTFPEWEFAPASIADRIREAQARVDAAKDGDLVSVDMDLMPYIKAPPSRRSCVCFDEYTDFLAPAQPKGDEGC